MNKKKHLALLGIVILTGIACGAELDTKKIATLIDAYEKQLDSVKLTYTYKFPSDEEGVCQITKGVFAHKRSEGLVLLDEKKQTGKAWDDDLESTGHARSYDGNVTRYLEHGTNAHGYHMAALYEDHNQKLYKTSTNPFYHFYRINYKTRIADLLNSPDISADILGEEAVDGVTALKIAIKRSGSSSTRYLWLLPEKNYLPIRYRLPMTVDGKEIHWQIDWSDFRESGSGTWFPWRVQTNFSDVAEPATIEVQEVDFTPLTKEDFEFAFPPLTHVNDHVLGTKYLTTPTDGMAETAIDDALRLADSSLSNQQKEAILDKYVERGKAVPFSGDNAGKAVEQVASDNETPFPYSWLSVTILLVLVAGAAYVKVRRRRSRT